MDLMQVLLDAMGNPLAYSLIFFVYVVLAAVILPIPVELGLFNPELAPPLRWLLPIIILAAGKGVGAYIVFNIGSRARKKLKSLSMGGKATTRIVEAAERFVRRYGHIGLFVIMSIPLMVDSVSLYLFSLLNPHEQENTALAERTFVGINVAAGAVRGIIILAVAYYVGIRLTG
ncbi:MAG: hypothetical protein R6U10_06380 [Thermoplasmatota archaeon]